MQDDVEVQRIVANLVLWSATQFAEGKSRIDILAGLEQEGCSRDLAQAIAEQGEKMKKAAFRREGVKAIRFGAGLAGVGILITAATYSMASGGGYYVVMTGLIMVGAWLVLKGLWCTLVG